MSNAAVDAWSPDRLLRWLLVWTAFTTVFLWLATVRGLFDGPSYQWGLFGFGGRGVHGAYWFPLLGSSLALLIMTLGWRGAGRPFRILLIGWHTLLAALVTFFAVSNPGALRFRGYTLGIDASLAIAGPLLVATWAGLAIYWVMGRSRHTDSGSSPNRTMPAWSLRNTQWLVALAALLPIQLTLLRFEWLGRASDPIGVFLIITQWLLIGRALRPYSVSPRAVNQ